MKFNGQIKVRAFQDGSGWQFLPLSCGRPFLHSICNPGTATGISFFMWRSVPLSWRGGSHGCFGASENRKPSLKVFYDARNDAINAHGGIICVLFAILPDHAILYLSFSRHSMILSCLLRSLIHLSGIPGFSP
jgi:hypothetical protein